MKGSIYSKNIRRTVFGSLGRYIAILAIIALGVGFFAGVKNTKASMMITCNDYVEEYNMYDFRLVSTYGFTGDDEKAMRNTDKVAAAEGAITADFFSSDRKGNSIILRAHSITEKINNVDIIEGRMPKADDECLADSHFYSAKDIGSAVRVTDENDDAGKDALAFSQYKIVGIMNSPYYMMKTERGNTSLGDGKVDAYIYAPEGAFTSEYFTEMFIKCSERGFIFSDEYDDNMAKAEPVITEAANERAKVRYDDIVSEAEKEITKGRAELDDGKAVLENKKASAYGQLEDAKATLDEKSRELSSGKQELQSQKSSLTSQRQQVANGISQVQQQLEAIDSEAMPEAAAALQQQLGQLQGNLAQIDAGLSQISQKEKELQSAQAQINRGYDEYYSGVKDADRQFAAAEEELAQGAEELKEAEEEIGKIEKPEIYIQDREDNLGYGSFESNADIVDSIAKIFPVFFFMIAALVCSTTMSRMIEEERMQIGTLRALGYTTGKIMFKYLFYSGSAAMIGCIAGFLAGSKYFPYFIWIAYGMMFGFAPLKFNLDWQLGLISLAVSLLCSMGTTYIACRGQLKHMPAEILRPRAPKSGKRIMLERIGILWNHLKFLHKVTARNIFRYKKRMVMMLLGIGGCTALVVAGFGIKDSVAGMADHQYSRIETYDLTVAFSEEINQDTRQEFEGTFDHELKSVAVLQQTSVNGEGPKAKKACNLMITSDENILKAVNFEDDDVGLDYPKRGEVMLNNKMAEMLGVKTGDSVTVNYDDTKNVSLKVSGIYRNYVSNYMYISAETYEKDMGKKYEPSIMFVTLKNNADLRDVSGRVNDFDGVIAVSANEDVKNRVDDMMVSLNYIIILVIGCAGALAFIVLFNLGNINITEREREIATIKVLGFYPRETGSYVFRENLILALIGIAVGLPGGFALHKFIMSRIVVDAVAFNDVVEPLSYLYTVIVVLGFTFIVDVILRRKLIRINMAEALKSVE